MKNKILAILLFAMMLLTITGCGKVDEKIKDDNDIKENENNKTEKELHEKLYDMIEPYFLSGIYPGFESYKDSNFYMDKEIKYEDLTDESRLYYAYKTIDAERKWFNSCEELKGYYYENEEISTTCTKSENAIIEKDKSSEEWFFENVDKKSLETAYHNMYGQDKELPLKSFAMNVTGICIYSESNDNFLCFNKTGGDTYPGIAEAEFDHYEEKEDSIEIYDRYLWIEYEIEQNTYYKSHLNKSEKIDTTEKDFSKGALYKHTFKKDDQGNYYWYSSVRVE